jgi:hypothetical protein
MFEAIQSLFGGDGSFYSFERNLLDEVTSHLDARGKELLRRQISSINKIQRLSSGREVNLYRLHRGKPAFDDSIRFPNAADEALLASAFLIVPNKLAKLKAEVWLAKGRLFSLVYGKPPAQFFAETGLKSACPQVVEMKIWCDPMRPSSDEPEGPVDTSMLTGWLREWFAKGMVSNLHAPLPESDRAALIGQITARLPADYVDLVGQTEGAKIGACTVYGLKKIREVVQPQATYYIVAELEGIGALVISEGGHDGVLHLMPYEGGDAKPIGSSLEQALSLQAG